MLNSLKKHISPSLSHAAPTTTTSSSTTAAPLPAFLAIPLSSHESFHSIYHTLSEREHKRMKLASQHNDSSTHQIPSSSLPNGNSQANGIDVKPTVGVAPPSTLNLGEKFAMRVGQSNAHKKKNRYYDIVAYDSTRVLLPVEGDGMEEYVNASLVVEPEIGVELSRNWWIAAQAPVASTVHPFLSLLLSPPKSHATLSSSLPPLPIPSTIIQLTPLIEQHRPKCHPYFPSTIGEIWVVDPPSNGGGVEGRRSIWIKLIKKEEKEGRRVSTLEVGFVDKENGEKKEGRKVTHVEYLGWGDHGVPDDPSHLLSFISYVNSLDPSLKILHCSAGVGRTGTYITISSLLPLLSLLSSSTSSTSLPLCPLPPHPQDHPLGEYPAGEIEGVETDYVGLTVDGLREQRCTMVQNVGQLRWCFEALKVAWEEMGGK